MSRRTVHQNSSPTGLEFTYEIWAYRDKWHAQICISAGRRRAEIVVRHKWGEEEKALIWIENWRARIEAIAPKVLSDLLHADLVPPDYKRQRPT